MQHVWNVICSTHAVTSVELPVLCKHSVSNSSAVQGTQVGLEQLSACTRVWQDIMLCAGDPEREGQGAREGGQEEGGRDRPSCAQLEDTLSHKDIIWNPPTWT